MKTYPGLFIVVPDSDYNATTPLLIETNILSTIMEDTRKAIGPRYLHCPGYKSLYAMVPCIQMPHIKEQGIGKTTK